MTLRLIFSAQVGASLVGIAEHRGTRATQVPAERINEAPFPVPPPRLQEGTHTVLSTPILLMRTV